MENKRKAFACSSSAFSGEQERKPRIIQCNIMNLNQSPTTTVAWGASSYLAVELVAPKADSMVVSLPSSPSSLSQRSP